MHNEKVIFIQTVRDYSNILEKKWVYNYSYNNYSHSLNINDIMIFVLLKCNSPKIIHATIGGFKMQKNKLIIHFKNINIEDYLKYLSENIIIRYNNKNINRLMI